MALGLSLGTFYVFSTLLQVPLPLGSGGLLMVETLQNLGHGFAIALSPGVMVYAFAGCVIGTLVGMLPGVGPLAGISLLLPASYGLNATTRHRDAGGHLLRRHVRRLDDVHPDAHPGRGGLGHDLHRRLRHDAQGPRGAGAGHRRRRLLRRRDRRAWSGSCSWRLPWPPSPCRFGPPEYRRPAAPGPDGPGLHERRLHARSRWPWPPWDCCWA